MSIEVASEILGLLMLAAFVAGFIDSIAGGGGLITLPALIIAGVPPVAALATNKIQGVFGAGMASVTYARAGHVDLLQQLLPAFVSFVGAATGAICATYLPIELIKLALPVLLIAVALFFAIKPGLDDLDKVRRMSSLYFMLTFVPVIGFYDGLIGPGTGAFFMLGFVTMAGYGILKATAHTKFLNFASNLGGIIAFAIVAKPLWITGFAMGLAQIAGAYVGSKLAIHVGARVIKPVLVISATSMALKLIFDAV